MSFGKAQKGKNEFIRNRLLNRLMWLILIAAAWQLTAVSGIFSRQIFPGLEEIFRALYLSVVNGEIVYQTFYSVFLIVKCMIIGLAAALILSSLAAVSRVFGSFLETITTVAHPLPGIALLPLIILWFGTGVNSIAFIIVHSVIWPLILNISTGFKSIPAIYREVGQNLGLKPLRIIVSILVPASLPYLLAGIKIGWARAWRALIGAEMIFGAVGAKGGLGWYIFKQRVFMDTPGMFAGLIVIVIIGIIVEDFIFNRMEKLTVTRWGMSI